MSAASVEECERFISQVVAVGGTVPQRLQYLLSGYELLTTQGASGRPERPIIDCLLDGKLTQAALDKLMPPAALIYATNNLRHELASTAARTVVAEFHRELKTGGAAEEILNSLRPAFTKHATAIAAARSLIDQEATPEKILATADGRTVEAYQQLGGHIASVTAIAEVARHFGGTPIAAFPQLKLYAQSTHQLDDRAVMAMAGYLVTDSAMLNRPDRGGVTSPWFRTPLRLWSVAEAQRRHDEWASGEWAAANSGPRPGRLIDGEFVEDPPLPNPWKQEGAA